MPKSYFMGMRDWRLATTISFWEQQWIIFVTLEGFHNPNINDNPGMTTPPCALYVFNHLVYVHHQFDRLIKLVAWVLVLFNVVTVFSLYFVCNYCLICCIDYCVDKKKEQQHQQKQRRFVVSWAQYCSLWRSLTTEFPLNPASRFIIPHSRKITGWRRWFLAGNFPAGKFFRNFTGEKFRTPAKLLVKVDDVWLLFFPAVFFS